MGVLKGFIPARGDVIWLNFTPQAGHEQAGRRPALVLSPKSFSKIGFALICPVTSRKRGNRFEVEIPNAHPIEGVILSHQVKSLDWKIRNSTFIFKLSGSTVNQVIARVKILLS